MSLQDEINLLIKQFTRTMAEDKIIHERWLVLTSEPDVVNDQLIPFIIKSFKRNQPDEYKDLWPGHIKYPLSECVEDPKKMLYEQLIQLLPLQRDPSDAVLTVMPLFGNAFLLSGLSLDLCVKNDMSEPNRTLSIEEVLDLKVADDLSECYYIKKAIEFIRYSKSVLPPTIHLGLCYMMSPFDLAYLIRGSELMIDLYTSPETVHHLMNLCTELYIKTLRLLKMEINEPDDMFRYFERAYRGGNILCEDCCVMLSPELHREFSLPYTKKVFDAIKGGWLHFCGDGSHLLDNYFSLDNLYGIQYGQLHLNGPYEDTVKKHMKHRVALHLGNRKKSTESWNAYFNRILELSRDHKYLDITTSYFDDAVPTEDLMKLWHTVQKAKTNDVT